MRGSQRIGLHYCPGWYAFGDACLADSLNADELDTLAAYVVAPNEIPAGEELFEQNCATCHGQLVPGLESIEQTRQIIAAGGSHETMPI